MISEKNKSTEIGAKNVDQLYEFLNKAKEDDRGYKYITTYSNDHHQGSRSDNGKSFNENIMSLIESNFNKNIGIHELVKTIDDFFMAWQAYIIDKSLFEYFRNRLSEELILIIENNVNFRTQASGIIYDFIGLQTITKYSQLHIEGNNQCFFYYHEYNEVIDIAKENWRNYTFDRPQINNEKNYKSWNELYGLYKLISNYSVKIIDLSSPQAMYLLTGYDPQG